MPVYNAEQKYLAEAGSSVVLGQSFTDFELLEVVDDGSTDGSPGVAATVTPKGDRRVQVVEVDPTPDTWWP